MITLDSSKKIIGVCLTKINDDFRKSFVDNLYKKTKNTDYKILVFNSVLDLYNNDVYDDGAKSIYSMINFELLDALVILSETIINKAVVDELIRNAHKRRIPVILVHGKADKCYCIERDYNEAFEEIIDHVLKCHGRKNPFFIGGFRGDKDSENRLECFKRVLSRSNIDFSDDMADNGEYWDVPTMKVLDRLMADKDRPFPDAFICANDVMAMTVCDYLKRFGYRIPEDISVTGFDGIGSADFFLPSLTTCNENIKGLSELVFSLIEKALRGEEAPGMFRQIYRPLIRNSCGCEDIRPVDFRKKADSLFHSMHDMEEHEKHIYTWMDTVLECTDISRLGAALSSYILTNSYVCLRSDFIANVVDKGPKKHGKLISDELIIFTSRNEDYTIGVKRNFKLSEMVPDLEKWLLDDTLCILSSIYVRDDVCGYYAVKTDNINDFAHRINRVSKTMNIAFTTVVNRMRQNRMRSSIENAIYTDSVTGLLNLKGLEKWFERFSAEEQNHNKILAVSVYGVPKYKYIYENYGINDIESAIMAVSETLLLANPENSMVARTGDDEFTVINYIDADKDICKVINAATALFFGTMEQYNYESVKDYYVEVNCGCTVAQPRWHSSLVNLIKLANGEMYLNRLKSGGGPVLKEKKSSKDKYESFNILISKNLFTYHFQPIVDAKTGEIFAYEALMRTAGGIRMSPLEILEIAQDYNRLQEIERATVFNVMKYFSENFEKFHGKKLFINTIPGSFLSKNDYDEILETYEDYFKYCVFEITEQETLSDDELSSMKRLKGSELAVDDFGTGHSNIVNLLRYAPQIIKIDRFLITDVHNDMNKQMFVKSAIEFARMNNIKIIAEGVEIIEEFQTLAGFGVDLIQGFYTAKPAAEPLAAIPDDIRNSIIMANSAFA